MKDRLKAYLGFAIKSGKIIFGYDKLFESKKNPILVLICSTLNEKNTNKVKLYCERNNIDYIKLNDILGELVSRDNCKVCSICDNNFASIICKELEMLNGNKKVGEVNIGK